MQKSSFKAGMYLLENLTSGMYNDPLSIYREYVQNAVDSFDMNYKSKGHYRVNIDLDPFTRSIRIFDNGMGISTHNAEDILSSIGDSNKRGLKLRGFRGIGRLGGIAFCDRAIFRTKAEGEDTETIQEWDCRKLKNILENTNQSLTFKQVFNKITSFEKKNNRQKNGSYFEVVLKDVSSFRNSIFDIEKVRQYLSQVAPIPFNPNLFSFSDKIDKYLAHNLRHYGKYNIFINGEQIFKPYRDRIRTTKSKSGGWDNIYDVELFEINIGNNKPIAYGWYGKRNALLGSISKGESCSGIRVRVGNIMIGSSHLLDKCFREDRFNSYVIGEVHVNSEELIPNSRRDDFIDNKAKTLFYNAIEKHIGLPISKNIRLKSRLSSQKSETVNTYNENRNLSLKSSQSQFLNIEDYINKLCNQCETSKKIISKLKMTF